MKQFPLWAIHSPAQQGGRKKRRIPPSSTFSCIQDKNGLDYAHPHWVGQSTLNPLIQMLISSGNTLTDTPRNNVSLGTLWPVELTHEINHHKKYLFHGFLAVVGRRGGVWGSGLGLGCASLSGYSQVKLIAQKTSCHSVSARDGVERICNGAQRHLIGCRLSKRNKRGSHTAC